MHGDDDCDRVQPIDAIDGEEVEFLGIDEYKEMRKLPKELHEHQHHHHPDGDDSFMEDKSIDVPPGSISVTRNTPNNKNADTVSSRVLHMGGAHTNKQTNLNSVEVSEKREVTPGASSPGQVSASPSPRIESNFKAMEP